MFGTFRAVKSCIKDVFKESFDVVFEHLANNGTGTGKVKLSTSAHVLSTC